MNLNTRSIEQLLFDEHTNHIAIGEVPLLFILAAPRCGSTLLYQLLADRYDFFFFMNFVNDHLAEYPAIGAALELAVQPRQPATFSSNYGKTEGPYGPSEGSFIFRNWFGGEHPAQTKSCDVLPGKAGHFRNTIACICSMLGRAILVKNAWNCFRIKTLTEIFPSARFLWLCRDLRASAQSDLEARYQRGGPGVWNSATPTNYREIQQRPYWEQVVEQQFEFNETVRVELEAFHPGRFLRIWYEDLCNNTTRVIESVERFMTDQSIDVKRDNDELPSLCQSAGPVHLGEDVKRILNYVESQRERLLPFSFTAHGEAI